MPVRQYSMDDKLVVTIPKDIALSTIETTILYRGLSLISSTHTVDEFDISCDLENIARRMCIFALLHVNPINEQSQPINDAASYNFSVSLNV